MEEQRAGVENPCDLEVLWGRFSGPLRRFIHSFGTDGDEADDILQEVFVRVHKGSEAVRDCAKLQSWIFQITRRVVFDHFRKRRPDVAFCECLPMAVEEDGGETPATGLAPAIGELIASLPEPYRTALQKSEIEGLPQKELAKALSISYSGAKSRVQRGRQMVRDLLLQCCHFDFDRRGAIIGYHDHCCCCAAANEMAKF